MTLFEQIIYEAPGDEAPPDMPAEDAAPPSPPPDMTDEGSDMGDDAGVSPPDMADDFGDPGDDAGGGFGDPSQEGEEELELDEKISAIMNQQLYRRFSKLLNDIAAQVVSIKNNSDMIYTLSTESLSIVGELKKLEENIRFYLTDNFLEENYSKNLLFFNKCLNLLKLLNERFDKEIQKGIRARGSNN